MAQMVKELNLAVNIRTNERRVNYSFFNTMKKATARDKTPRPKVLLPASFRFTYIAEADQMVVKHMYT